MIKKISFSLLFIFTILSCRTDLDFKSDIGNLSFSKETVYLDTVFTNIGSSTYRLKVYNTTNENISIPKVGLKKGQFSKYQLNVDGMPGKEFENVELLAKDSMFVFISVNANVSDTNPADFLYTDEIQFGDNFNFQKVNLVTLIQDAIFIYPERNGSPNNYTYEEIQLDVDENNNPITITGSNLNTNDPINGNELHFNNSKPYVIYGYAKVPDNETLVIDAGARVHFHANSGLIVGENASLKVNGSLSNTENLEHEVIFEGDRLEYSFSETPGQWGTIWFLPGSVNNEINYLTLKNATVGLFVTDNDGTNNPTINISNSQFYNCSNVGILGRKANITGKNIVVNNCGQASLACTLGGNYDFTHCTFANYFSSTNQTSVLINNYLETSQNLYLANLNQCSFKNCAIYGSNNLSFSLEKRDDSTTTFNYLFENCLLKMVDSNNLLATNALYNTTSANYLNNKITTHLVNFNPLFKNTFRNQFEILSNSACINNANNLYSTFPDIKNISRAISSDIGAYELP